MKSSPKIIEWIIIVAGLVPLLFLLRDPPATKYLVFSLMGVVWLLRDRLSLRLESWPVPGRVGLKLFVLVVLVGLLQEYCLWLHEYYAGNLSSSSKHIFVAALSLDMAVAFAYYAGLAIALVILAHWLRLPILPLFIIGALLGLYRESYHVKMDYLLMDAFKNWHSAWVLLKTLAMSFAAHAPVIVIPLLLLEEKFPPNRMQPIHVEFMLIALTLWLGANTLYFLFMKALQVLKIIQLK